MSEVEFELRKLGDLIEIYNNKRVPLSAKQREGLEKIYPYYGAQGIVDYVDDYIFDGKYILIAEDGENLKSNNKSICTLATGKYWVNNHAHIIEGNDETNTDFLYYKLNSISFAPYITGSAQPKLNKENLLNIELYIPSREHQDKIAKVLTLLDQKIQTNNQINQELEAMAKTLYDYWFVQFDFPDQNGKPYKSSGGKMVYHPELKREIPEGWGVETLKDLESKIITGKTPSRANSDNFGGEIPFITIGDIRGNTFIYNTSETLTDLGASVQQNKYLPEGSLCVSCIATVGEIGFTTEWSHTNQQINSIVFEDETNRYYLYFALKNYFENANASAKTGNTFANMNKEDFSGIRIILPRNEIKNNFHKMTEPYFAQIKCLQGQNKELTQLRDWLLPMLMNGQVQVE